VTLAVAPSVFITTQLLRHYTQGDETDPHGQSIFDILHLVRGGLRGLRILDSPPGLLENGAIRLQFGMQSTELHHHRARLLDELCQAVTDHVVDQRCRNVGDGVLHIGKLDAKLLRGNR
jgi:hypothetical protein